MTTPQPKNDADENDADDMVTLPVIAGRRGSRGDVAVAGRLVAVIPQLATTGLAAEHMRDVAERLKNGDTVDDGELDAILGDQEVMYIVVGKWPPLGEPPTERPTLSEPARELVEKLRNQEVATMVFGPWPPSPKRRRP